MQQAREERSHGTKPVVCLVPSRVTRTRIGKELDRTLRMLGEKTLPPVSQRAVVTEATMAGLTVIEYAQRFNASHMEFKKLGRAVQRVAKSLK